MLAGVLGTAFLAACASTGQRVVVPWRAGNATSLQMGTVEEHRAQAAHGVLPITLYRPTGAGPFPFVVLLHGCGGLKHDAIWTQWVQPWAALFHDYGIGTAVVDSFGPRGVAHVCTGDVAAWAVRRADVAYSSRVWLAEHPDVDAVFEGMWGRCPGCCKSVAEQKHRANGFQHRLVQGLRASLTPVSSTRAVEGFFLCPESRTGALTSTLCGAHHECAAGCFDHILWDDMEFVNTPAPLYLHKQPMEQPEVAPGEAAAGSPSLRVRKIRAVEGQAQLAPMARQPKGELVILPRTVVMRAADTAVKLRITRQAFFDARHANAQQADRRAITHITQMFAGGRRETFGFIHDAQRDPPVPSDPAWPSTVEAVRLFDTALHARRQQRQVLPEFTHGAADRWGRENRLGTRSGSLHVGIGGLAWPPGVEQRFGQLPVGMAAA